MNYETSWKGDFFSDVFTCIINDDILFQNKYLDKLREDFPDWKSYKTINLGIINSNKDYEIMHAIKLKYPKLDIVSFEIVDKTDYSQFNPFFSCKIKIIGNKYSNGKSMETFSYLTQTKLNELNNIIANDKDIKIWINDINYWNSTLPQAEENAKTFTPQQLYNWKRQELINIQNYKARWDTTARLINDTLKIDELNKNVQGLKLSFDTIKKQVNELKEKVKDLEKPNYCGSQGYVVSGVTGVIALAPIPIIQPISASIAALSGAAAAICSL